MFRDEFFGTTPDCLFFQNNLYLCFLLFAFDMTLHVSVKGFSQGDKTCFVLRLIWYLIYKANDNELFQSLPLSTS